MSEIPTTDLEFVQLFPTHQDWQKDGPTVSFSEISTWLECPYRHMLAYVKRINTYSDNVHTVFGGQAHSFAESFLLSRHADETKRQPILTKEQAIKDLKKAWVDKSLGDPYTSPTDDPMNWVEILERVVDDIQPFMDSTFHDWKCFDAEEKLAEVVENFPPKFKGYVDGVLQVTDAKGKITYWLIDWKFTNHWTPQKKSDMKIKLQLVLYKHFWSIKHSVPHSQIRCGFILAKKKAKPGKTFELVPVSVGPKTLENGLKMFRNMLTNVKKGFNPKKRSACNFCPYSGTEHCV